MELSDKQYLEICRYTSGEMDEKERALFEEAMQRDAVLLREVQRYKEAESLFLSASGKIEKEGIMPQHQNRKGEDEVWRMLARAREEWEGKNDAAAVRRTEDAYKPLGRVVGMQRRMMWAAAVVFGVIILAGTWWYQQHKHERPDVAKTSNQPKKSANPFEPGRENKPPDSAQAYQPGLDKGETPTPPLKGQQESPLNAQALFAANFTPDVVPENKAADLEEALGAYAKKDYGEAIENLEMQRAGLETRSEEQPDATTAFYVHYYLGLSYLATSGRTQNAIVALTKALRAAKSEQAKSKVKWYLALAYLKMGALEEAQRQLSQVGHNQQAGIYRYKAQELVKQFTKDE